MAVILLLKKRLNRSYKKCFKLITFFCSFPFEISRVIFWICQLFSDKRKFLLLLVTSSLKCQLKVRFFMVLLTIRAELNYLLWTESSLYNCSVSFEGESGFSDSSDISDITDLWKVQGLALLWYFYIFILLPS